MIIYDEPAQAYHANPAIGSNLAKLARKSIRLFRDAQLGLIPKKKSPALTIGNIVHMRVLEPDKYAAVCKTEGPINPKTGKPYGRDTQKFEEWQAENPDVIMVEPYIDMMCERMPESVKTILRHGKPEVTFRTDDDPATQARPDWFRGDCVYDLKTIGDVDQWERDIRKWQYWFSAGWYKMVMNLCCEDFKSWRFIFCEKNPPYRWRIVRMSSEYLDHALNNALEIYSKILTATKTDTWTDPDEGELIAELPLDLSETNFTVDEDGGISL